MPDSDLRADPALAAALARLIDRAIAEEPKLDVDRARFEEHLAGLFAGGEQVDPAALDQARAGDLLLAWAAVEGEPAALAAVDALITDAAARVCKTWDHDEVAQYLRVDALVGAGPTPGLLRYAGRGRLLSWLRVGAARFAVHQARRRRREVSMTALEMRPSPVPEPDEGAMRREHRPALKKAVVEAFQALAPEPRELLWRAYVAGATVDDLAAELGVHRATAARRVGRARQGLHAELRRAAPAVDEDELDELLVAAWRDLSQSLGTLTGHRSPPPGG